MDMMIFLKNVKICDVPSTLYTSFTLVINLFSLSMCFFQTMKFTEMVKYRREQDVQIVM